MTTRYPAGTRTARVVQVLHDAATEGLTIGDLADACDLKPYEAKEILHRLLTKGKRATLVAARRNAVTGKLDEVWACSCRLDHRPQVAQPTAQPDARLDDAARERGRAGVAAARAILDQAANRSQAS